MFPSRNAEQFGRALDLSMAIIEFNPQGVVLKANENFCDLMVYRAGDRRQTSLNLCRCGLREISRLCSLLEETARR